MAAVAHQRSPTKFAPADWHTANFVIASSSERQRTTAHDVRQQSQRLRNDTGRVCVWGVCVGGGREEINKLSSMARSHRDTWKLQLISTNTPCPPQHTHTHTHRKQDTLDAALHRHKAGSENRRHSLLERNTGENTAGHRDRDQYGTSLFLPSSILPLSPSLLLVTLPPLFLSFSCLCPYSPIVLLLNISFVCIHTHT